MSFIQNIPEEAAFNPLKKIGKEWMLVTAGTPGSFNTMTASWGGVGVMWNKNVVTAVIRPSRYTYEFMKKEDTFSLSFFGGKQKEALSFCGSHSGRDCDKIKETGLTPVFIDGTPAFDEAETVLICKKLYCYPLDEKGFIDKDILASYNGEALHVAFVAEITGMYSKA